jgi:hypothetical protein
MARQGSSDDLSSCGNVTPQVRGQITIAQVAALVSVDGQISIPLGHDLIVQRL